MSNQEQFLDVVDRDEAERRFRAALRLAPVGEDLLPLAAALGRVLARDVVARVDVPSFDRSNFDGFALRAADTYGAAEEAARTLRLLAGSLHAGTEATATIEPGTAMTIATGGMVPRGADAVMMVEHTEVEGGVLTVRRPVAPGHGVSFAGSDMAAGELILARGELLTSRETGVLAAVGEAEVWCFRRPRVAILSTGNELIAPGQPMRAGLVYDSNARILADAVRELGGEPWELGVVGDDAAALRERLAEALATADVVLLSGGTSKGEGDLSYRVVRELTRPGIVVHGVALKPGKPICLAVHDGKPVVVLPGFPTSAVFTFHEFVAPVIRRLAGRTLEHRETVEARLPVRVNSEVGRTEYLLVSLLGGESNDWTAYPLGKGSGSVTAFSRADGFVTIDRHVELVEAGTRVAVTRLAHDLRPADLVVIGSHCVGLDLLLGELRARGFTSKFLAVGSTLGLRAAQRGECDVAGVHLFDPSTGEYNRPFLTPELELIPGYGRLQGVVFRRGDSRFEGRTPHAAVAAVRDDPRCLMINRNQGSGTRVLIDGLLAGREPAGFAVQARSHNAVAAAVAQGRADWGVAIENVARLYGLGFLPLQAEQYDLVTPVARRDRPAVVALRQLLSEPAVRERLRVAGFRVETS